MLTELGLGIRVTPQREHHKSGRAGISLTEKWNEAPPGLENNTFENGNEYDMLSKCFGVTGRQCVQVGGQVGGRRER